MKTQTFFKLVFAIILILQVEQINFSQNNQARTISFERNTQVGTSVKALVASFDAATDGKSPSIAEGTSGGFVVAYIPDDASIMGKTISADGTLGTAKTLVSAAENTVYTNPSIAMLTGGSYILCYSSVVTVSGESTTYTRTTPCKGFTTELVANTIVLADAFKSPVAASYQSAYGLSDKEFGILIHDGKTLKSAVGTTSTTTSLTPVTIASLTASTSPAQMAEFTSSSVAKVAIVYMSSTLKIQLAITTLANFVSASATYTSGIFDLVTATTTTVSQPSVVVLSNGKLYIAYVETVSTTSNTIKYIICPASVTKADDCTTAAALTDPSTTGTKDCQYPHGALLTNGQVFLTASCAAAFGGDFGVYGILLDSAGAAVTNGKFDIVTVVSTKEYMNAQLVLSSTNVGIVASDSTKTVAAIYQEIALSTSGQLLNQVISLATLSVALLFLLFL